MNSAETAIRVLREKRTQLEGQLERLGTTRERVENDILAIDRAIQLMSPTVTRALSATQVAKRFGWSVRTLQSRMPSLGLPYIQVGTNGMVFLSSDVDAFLFTHTVANDQPVVEPLRRGRGRPKGSRGRPAASSIAAVSDAIVQAVGDYGPLTTADVIVALGDDKCPWPKHAVRRALTALAEQGRIIAETVAGTRRTYLWSLPEAA